MYIRFIFVIFVVLSDWSSLVLSSEDYCPDISTCAPENIVNQTCHQVCNEKPSAIKSCSPVIVPKQNTIGLINVKKGPFGRCVNKEGIEDFKNCRGSCHSEDVYNTNAKGYELSSTCCRLVEYKPLNVVVSCEDGTQQKLRVYSAERCECNSCENTWKPTNSGSSTQGPPHIYY